MATLLQVDRVQYVFDSDTEESQSLARLYFCIYCLALRSSDDLQHEDDSHFCPQTLDGVASQEAVSKKNKCSNLWRCPSCIHPLFTRATSTLYPPSGESSKPTVKMVYYQVCTFCRWSTRCVGIPDKEVLTGTWAEKTNPTLPRITKLFEYYKYLEQKEKRDNARRSQKKKDFLSIPLQLKQKYTSGKSPGKKSVLGDPLSTLRMKEPSMLKEVEVDSSPTLGLEDLEVAAPGEQVDFTSFSSIGQRLDQPDSQVVSTKEFVPRRSNMFLKQSLRCKTCDHNIIKPEYSPTSIKFKIHLIALNHIPEIRVHKACQLSPGVQSRVILSLCNPTEHVIHTTFLPLDGKLRQPNAQIELPKSEVMVGKYDEASDLLAQPGASPDSIPDDPSLIAYRRGNKVGFFVDVLPDSGLTPGDEIWVGMRFKHEHFGAASVALLLKGEGQVECTWLTHTLYVNVGHVI
uniref:Dynactin subunit 4 n=1 Tax=Ciona savignyi TaxID=51511 RepID=H2YNG3_CIOSA